METSTPHHRQLLALLSFLACAFALGLAIWLTFGGSAPLSPKGYRLTVPLKDASNLYPQADIQVSGVKIGRIVSLRRGETEARAVVEIESRFAPVRSGATAIKREKSLLGEGYIEIAPGPARARPIPDGGVLSRSNVRPSQSLDDVLETFSPRARGDLKRLASRMAGAFEGRAQSISDSIGTAQPVLESFDRVFSTLRGQERQLGSLFAASADVLDAAGGRQASLRQAIAAGDRVLSTTASSGRDLTSTIRALPPFLTELRRASHVLSATTGDLDSAVTALTPAVPRLGPALGAIDAAAPEFQRAFRALTPVLKAGDRGLPAASGIVRAAGSSAETVYPVSREMIPVLQLIAELRGAVPSFFANVGQFINGTVPTGNGPIHAPAGVPAIWNETVAGWKSRLPSNRPNPYPKPGAALEMAKKGSLLSYDCRHTGNPELLPPTGLTGAPPCRTQGPWTFNGESRYYPRLTLAPP